MLKPVLAAFLVAMASGLPALAQDREPDALRERAIERRAVEAITWGMPFVNYDRMLQAATAAGAGPNKIVYWSGLFDWKNQTLTPNPDTIYLMPFFDTKDGPMVLEIPAATDSHSLTGTIMDVWQAALEDIGPAGADKGAGAKYLILPPGHDGAVPEGYVVLPSSTYGGYALLRSNLRSADPAAVKAAADYALGVRLYPLAEAANPPATTYVDVLGQEFDSTIPYDIRFFESLDRVVQDEPWLPRDKVMVDMLRTIGIEKGQPFEPSPETETILERAIGEAHAWLDLRLETAFEPYFDGTHWAVPATPEMVETSGTFYETPDTYAVDARGLTDTWGFSTVKHLGTGQFYLMTTRDAAGEPLDGAASYRLTVPADVPASQYWSAVLYDRATHALIRGMASPSKSSNTPGLVANPDGSVDLWFGPEPPAGKEANWTPTDPDGRFEVLFRLYGPEPPLFDKSWVLTDIEKVAP